MKVMKFGGTSVGSVKSILSVKDIVLNQKEPVIVVVSALGGITDKLIQTATLAATGSDFKSEFDAIVTRHISVASGVIFSNKLEKLLQRIEPIFTELFNGYKKIAEEKKLSTAMHNTIVSYGERMSSLIVSEVLGSQYFYSPDFIKTKKQGDKNIVDVDLTNACIAKTFASFKSGIALCPGFISTDNQSGEITNLGRGGSDYTAALIAAELQASILEIWTDVDGFLTADPRVISDAYVIEQLSFVEAMELCTFGAKVIYPPTIFPVYHKNIPIVIKNTFNPSAKGSYISKERNTCSRTIKGISSINDTALVTMEGMGMVGVTGVSQRLFGALANAKISAFFISQASSESTITIGVKNSEADTAAELLRKEFARELQIGEINDVKTEKDLATVAVVGDNMKRISGISGKLFGTLGRAGINVVAIAQGASETNISFVINAKSLQKTLSVIHESFFLSEYQEINLLLCGIGTVGSNLLMQIDQQAKKLQKQNRLKIKVVGVATSKKVLFNRDGIDLKTYREQLDKKGINSSPEFLKNSIIEMNLFNAVFVDCTASADIAALYKDFLSNNISVVAANKIAASSAYETYAELKEIARAKGIKYLFETNVGAGLPIVNTINNLINSGDKILKMEAVLSGTLNYIFNTLSTNIPLSKTIQLAKEMGYAEPDPRIDLSGKDVVRKLVILAREAGYKVEQTDVEKNLFIPNKYFEGSIDDFWNTISELDNEFEEKRKRLAAQDKKYRFVATMDHGKCSVGLQEVDLRHPFYDLEGSNNIIMITTERYHEYPMIIKGYGAGANVTAAGVFADIISVANVR